MPYHITFTLDTKDAPLFDRAAVIGLHGAFFDWLGAVDKGLRQKIHTAEIKPFALSPLFYQPSNASAVFYLGILRDELWESVRKGIERTSQGKAGEGGGVELFGCWLPFVRVPQVIHKTYADLAQQTRGARTLDIEFLTATTFKRNEMDYPLPEPVLVFSSFWARWNQFAPVPFKIQEHWKDWVEGGVGIAEFDLKSERFDFPKHSHTGFVGQVRFRVLEDLSTDREGSAPLETLAEFALFCGTGRKTAQGMGQTRRVRG